MERLLFAKSIIKAPLLKNKAHRAVAIHSQMIWRSSRSYSNSSPPTGTGTQRESKSSNNGYNWGPPLTLFAVAGLGYYYFFSNKDKGNKGNKGNNKDASNTNNNPLDSLDKLQDAEVVFVLGGKSLFIQEQRINLNS